MMLEINVTEEDIKTGEVGDAHYCPVAKAVKRQFEKLTGLVPDVRVDGGIRIKVGVNTQYFDYDDLKLSDSYENVADFVDCFDGVCEKDHGHELEPFKFHIPLY